MSIVPFKDESFMKRFSALLKIYPTAFLFLLPILLLTRSVQAQDQDQDQDQDSNIIVHVHNLEGIEIGMIPDIGGNSVEIRDGDIFIANGASDSETLNKPIPISSGIHDLKVKFNGITKEQSVSIDPGETKTVIFTFDRKNYIGEIEKNLPMNFSGSVSVAGLTDSSKRVWNETSLYAIGGDFWAFSVSADITANVQGAITPLAEKENRFHMEHHLTGATSKCYGQHALPPDYQWSAGVTGFSLINQQNVLTLPQTCTWWFVQGWGNPKDPLQGGISLQVGGLPAADESNQQKISSVISHVGDGSHYVVCLQPGLYNIRGGFEHPAGAYSIDNSGAESSIDYASASDIEIASSVSDIPYYFGLYIEAQVDKPNYAQNDLVNFSCIVKDGFTGLPITTDTITATVTLPDGSKQEASLTETSTGNYNGSFKNTSFLGGYQIAISAKKAGYPDGSFKINFIVGMLEVLDGSVYSAGKSLSTDPEILSWGGTEVEGAAADGVTRLLLRIKLNNDDRLEFSIVEGSMLEENGFFRTLDGSGQAGNIVTVNSVSVGVDKYAFVVYQVPDNFARPSNADNERAAERTITFNVRSVNTSSQLFSKQIKIVRPPVILMHGIWSNPKMWITSYNLSGSLYSTFPGIYLVFANYKQHNADSFETNKEVVSFYIKTARDDLLQRKIAMVRADIIAYSMGGVLAHIYAESGQGEYLRPDNFFAGDINRLITLNSPHKGAFAADLTEKFINDNSIPLGIRGEFMLLCDKMHMPLDRGAVFDLMTTSDETLRLNSKPAFTSCHVIAGNVSIPGTADIDKFLVDTAGSIITSASPDWLQVILDILASKINPYRDEYLQDIVDGHSDLVVSVDSQRGGIAGDSLASTTLNYWHTGLDNDVTNEIIILLNASPDTVHSPYFSAGFPLGK